MENNNNNNQTADQVILTYTDFFIDMVEAALKDLGNKTEKLVSKLNVAKLNLASLPKNDTSRIQVETTIKLLKESIAQHASASKLLSESISTLKQARIDEQSVISNIVFKVSPVFKALGVDLPSFNDYIDLINRKNEDINIDEIGNIDTETDNDVKVNDAETKSTDDDDIESK